MVSTRLGCSISLFVRLLHTGATVATTVGLEAAAIEEQMERRSFLPLSHLHLS